MECVLHYWNPLVSEAPETLLKPTEPGCSTLHASDCQSQLSLFVSPTRVDFLLLTIKVPNKNYNVMAKKNYEITPWKNNAIKNHSLKNYIK